MNCSATNRAAVNCATMADSAESFTEDGFLGGRLLLRQPARGHRVGHDAMLLAASTAAWSGARVIEFGAGVGAAGLALATRVPDIDLVLIEIDASLTAMARFNADRNRLSARTVTFDVTSDAAAFSAQGLPPESADAVMMNPPFNADARHRPSPDVARQNAHMATAATLQKWVDAAHRLLKTRGALTMIWRADGLAEVVVALTRGFGGLAIQPVHGTRTRPAIRVLVRAVKGGRAPLAIHPGLFLDDPPDEPAPGALGGQDVLPLGRITRG